MEKEVFRGLVGTLKGALSLFERKLFRELRECHTSVDVEEKLRANKAPVAASVVVFVCISR